MNNNLLELDSRVTTQEQRVDQVFLKNKLDCENQISKTETKDCLQQMQHEIELTVDEKLRDIRNDFEKVTDNYNTKINSVKHNSINKVKFY